MTVAGHPRRIREFHDAVRGDGWLGGAGGSPVDWIVTELVVEGFRAAKRKWQGRHDPPLGAVAKPDGARTVVCWRWERLDPDGEPVGPVCVDTYVDGDREPVESQEWPDWTRRSEALAYASEHDFQFFPDE